MDHRQQQLIDEVQQLRKQYLAEIGDGGRKPWPKSIKQRVLELCRSDLSAAEVSELTEIPYHSVLPWRKEVGLVRAKAPHKFHALTVTDKTSTAKEPVPTRTVTVEIDGVGQVRCETVQDAATLVLLIKQGASNAL